VGGIRATWGQCYVGPVSAPMPRKLSPTQALLRRVPMSTYDSGSLASDCITSIQLTNCNCNSMQHRLGTLGTHANAKRQVSCKRERPRASPRTWCICTTAYVQQHTSACFRYRRPRMQRSARQPPLRLIIGHGSRGTGREQRRTPAPAAGWPAAAATAIQQTSDSGPSRTVRAHRASRMMQ
jgi:hypothetical protein